MAQENEKCIEVHNGTRDSSSKTGGSQAARGSNANSTQTQSSPQQFASGTTQFLLPKNGHSGQLQGGHQRRWQRWPLWLALATLAVLIVYHFRSLAEANNAGTKSKPQ